MSRQYLGPYINFQGRAREAMEFYHKVLGGKLDLGGPGDRITHARLEAEGAIIIATDGHPDYPAKVGENIAIAVGGTDKDRLTKLYHDLADGGSAKMPPSEQSEGWLTDRFGINWTVRIERG
jgi:PhnB protein